MLRISHFTITEQSQQAPNTPPLAPIQQLWPSDEKAVLLLSYSNKNLMYSQMLRWTSGRTAPCQYHGYNDCVLCPTWLFVGKSHRAVSKNEQYSISSWLIICTLQGRLTRNCWSWVGKFCHTHHIAWTLPYLTIIYLLPPANFHCGGNCLATKRSWNCGWQFFTSKPTQFFFKWNLCVCLIMQVNIVGFPLF